MNAWIKLISCEVLVDEILRNSKENLGISEFLDISKEYVNKNFNGIDLENFFDKAVAGFDWS